VTRAAPRPSTTDVLLRDVIAEDLPIFFEHQLDPEATRMAAFPARGRRAFMAHWTEILADQTVDKQTILVGGQVAGNVVCYDQSGERTVGYWLGREYWGKGVATRALSAFLKRVTTRPLYAHVAKHNVASVRVLEKCGFAISGEERGIADVGDEAVAILVLKLGTKVGEAAP
jgi:RimJ/RimL family protein N-acetyltransferase